MDDNHRNRIAAALLGALVCVFALAVIAGWYWHFPILFQGRPDWPPVQFNAAVGFAALGLGLVARALERRIAAGVLAVIPLAIGVATLVTWVLDLSPGIDELLFQHYVTTLTLIPGRMPVNNAMGLMLGAAGLLVAAFPPRPAVITAVWTLGLIALFRGSVGTVWSTLDAIGVTPRYLGSSHMAVQVSVCVALSGAALLLLTHRLRSRVPPRDRIWQLPILAGVSMLMVSLLLWQSLSVAENTRTRLATHDALIQTVMAVEADSQDWDREVSHAAKQASLGAGTIPAVAWEREAREILSANAWLREIIWLKADGAIRSRVSRTPGDPMPDLASLGFVGNAPAATALPGNTEGAKDSKAAAQSADRAVVGLVAAIDVGVTTDALWFIGRVDDWLREVIGDTARDYDVSVADGDHVVFSRTEAGSRSSTSAIFDGSAELSALGKRWVLWISPGINVTAGPASTLPGFVFLFGVTVSLLVALALRYATVVRMQSSGIHEAGARLNREVEERRRAEIAARDSEARAQRALADVQQILNQSQDLICTVNREGVFLTVSPSSWNMFGYRPEEMVGHHWREFVFPQDLHGTASEVAAIRCGKVTREFENRYVHRNGKLVQLSWSSTWVAETGTSYSIARDVTTRNRQIALREGQRQVLQLIAEGAALQQVLDAICSYVELIDPESLCSILLVDGDGLRLRSSSAPSLPADYVDEVDGIEIGPTAGSCGTAAWRKQLVIVDNLETDPLWSDFRPLALRHGLKSC